MKDITCFSANTLAKFENNYDNIVAFNELMVNANNGVFEKYSKEQTQEMIRTQFNSILGIDFKNAKPMARRQAWRNHGKEIASLIENIVVDNRQKLLYPPAFTDKVILKPKCPRNIRKFGHFKK